MDNGEAHVVLHCLVFPAMEVGGDQAGGQAGEDGDEEVEAKGFVNVKFTGRRCWSWEKVWEKVVGDPFQNACGWGTKKADSVDDADVDPSRDNQECIKIVGPALRVGSWGKRKKHLGHPHGQLA